MKDNEKETWKITKLCQAILDNLNNIPTLIILEWRIDKLVNRECVLFKRHQALVLINIQKILLLCNHITNYTEYCSLQGHWTYVTPQWWWRNTFCTDNNPRLLVNTDNTNLSQNPVLVKLKWSVITSLHLH